MARGAPGVGTPIYDALVNDFGDPFSRLGPSRARLLRVGDLDPGRPRAPDTSDPSEPSDASDAPQQQGPARWS
ncbi:hypothetical protein ACFC1T_20140 [Kitasatospora sp. NPDC056076]|uniref:hypothetical protein n=1 Tax=Kitasatospora sp. NPDC056076 TaxID=3345703 RepID=UPI0035E2494D